MISYKLGGARSMAHRFCVLHAQRTLTRLASLADLVRLKMMLIGK
jgi:hypothetical protein